MINQGPVVAFAHRGGAYHPEIEGLENTMAAFEHAVALGYTHLETDVHTTSDGVLLAFHDAVLDRVTDTRGEIAGMTLADVRAARIGTHHQVPTLAELFDAFPQVRFNIDLKAAPAALALAAFLEERDAFDRTIVTSFSPTTLREFRRLSRGRARTGAHPLEVAAYLVVPSARLARMLTPGRPVALQIPHTRGPLTVASRGLIRRAHANGVQVHVWTIDDPAEMRALLDRGVDGLMTDRTDLLKDVLLERGQWREER
ncbi:glycerophosphodiester phosphodiesterase family protein [Nocardioides sp. CER19]|uniref:glycerophosphodiester phosphodiesterase family protein n=1 Tax=Nocardioides sp. CER19 TaxID=3038538 RepID=UPI00244BFD92|nr:glycerophosphodiester phosphodiesterase family protein [Nocardioides sp. CER19]MDH2415653.1 glycerophosphodiester phosphodiesterase family protein [Nocardioides sp. CER19]